AAGSWRCPPWEGPRQAGDCLLTLRGTAVAHLTFIHGIANKPPSDALLALWLNALADSGGPDLRPRGGTTPMVYWPDVLYDSPPAGGAVGAVEAPGADPLLAGAPPPPAATASGQEGALTAGLAMKFGAVAALAEAAQAGETQLERVPVP